MNEKLIDRISKSVGDVNQFEFFISDTAEYIPSDKQRQSVQLNSDEVPNADLRVVKTLITALTPEVTGIATLPLSNKKYLSARRK